MIISRQRSCARWLSRCNRLRLRSRLSDREIIGAAAASPPSSLFSSSSSSSSFSPASSVRHFHSYGRNHRHSSSIFWNSLIKCEFSNERKARATRECEDGGGGNDGRGGDGRTTQNGRRQNPNKRQPDRNPRSHSVRLIGESAARETTKLFLEEHDRPAVRLDWYLIAKDNYDTALWEDAASLLAAEQALEFWAHRSNDRGREDGRHRRGERRDQSRESGSTLEEDAEMAFHLFAALHHFHVQTGCVLTNGMYSHVVDALAKSPDLDHVRRADALLRQFIRLHVERYAGADENNPLPPVPQMELKYPKYPLHADENSQIKASRRPVEIPGSIVWSTKDNHHFPNQIRITGVMRGYARQSRPEDAEALFGLMVALSRRNKRMFSPNEVGFATVIDAYSRVHDGSNAQRVLQLMKERSLGTGAAPDERAPKDETGPPPVNGANVVAYNAAISAWARSAKKHSAGENGAAPSPAPSRDAISSSRAAAESAESLLREMWSEHEIWSERRRKYPGNVVLPDVVTYSTVISGYTACLDQPYGMKRARELLVELEGLAVQEFNDRRAEDAEQGTTAFRGNGGGRNSRGFQPNTMVYNTILQAYANAGDASTAETILHSMISLHSASLKEGGGGPYRNICPDTRTFNAVLNAWSKNGGTDGGMRANGILDRLEKMASDGDGLTKPDVISYNTVLAAWSKSARVCPSTLSEGEEDAQSSSIVGKSAAYKALELLDTIEQRYLQSQRDGENHQRSRVVKPDAISYSTTISAFANAAQHSGEDEISLAEEAEALLSRMKDRLGIEPDAYSHNGVLLAWARSSGGGPAAVRRAVSILRSMSNPTVVSWSTVVNAYARADCAPEAEALVREMEQNVIQHRRGRAGQGARAPVIPSIVLYNNVLHAWGRSSDADASRNAAALLDRMEGAAAKFPAPDAISYALVLTALQHGRDPDKAVRARAVLDRFLASIRGRDDGVGSRDVRDGGRRVRDAFNCVLTSCAYTPADAGERHRRDAARILVETLRDMNATAFSTDGDASDGPDQESYALFLQGCSHLFEPDSEERNVLLKSAFRECCRMGLLNSTIWDKFCSVTQPDLVKTCMEEMSSGSEIGPNYEDLPEEWSSSDVLEHDEDD